MLLQNTKRAFAYARDTSDEKELSPKEQEEICSSWFDMQQKVGAIPAEAKWMHTYCDHAYHGTIEFFYRPMADKMMLQIKPGDLIVTAKFNRMFQRDIVKSYTDTVTGIDKTKAALMIVDSPNLSTALIPNCALQVLDELKERALKTRKHFEIQKASSQKKMERLWLAEAPLGWMRQKDGTLIPNEAQRRVAILMLEHYENGQPQEAVKIAQKHYPHLDCTGTRLPERYAEAARLGFPIKGYQKRYGKKKVSYAKAKAAAA